ncbi:hypothetical protein F4778DRAFT_747697 [Xylariomycetidae sp. FL2044]|nr:hypothetical protein F4778DRAFT_747697 [Xylariomycetidae sp. FL2044]
MEVASPPKRMTRARAAAKDAAATSSQSTTSKSTTSKSTSKSATAPAKRATSSTAASSARAIPTKRKTRHDDDEEDDPLQTDPEQNNTAMNRPAKTRGRPKKTQDPEPNPETESHVADAPVSTTTRATRGRAKKTATTSAAAPKQEPAKNTRTRTRKATMATTEDKGAEPDAASEPPVKKTARRRAASNTKTSQGIITTTVSTEPTPGLKSAVSRPASRIGGVVKKTVTFQEPEKENMRPPPTKKAKTNTTESATGLRARPVRKPATGRTTRASAKAATTEEKKEKAPLSPKKDGQNLPLNRDNSSDDELATYEKTPLRPMQKSPVKFAASPRKPQGEPMDEDDVDSTKQVSEPTISILASPARRPLQSSVNKEMKESMKSPAKRGNGVPSLALPPANSDEQGSISPMKMSLFQSPAKRAPVPMNTLQPPSHDQSGSTRSPMKMSLLNSPAKRPMSPMKLFNSAAKPVEEKPEQVIRDVSPPVGETTAKEMPHPEPAEQLIEEDEDDVLMEEAHDGMEVEPESPTPLSFPGRLSAVLPRHADPALKEALSPANQMMEESLAIVPAEPVGEVEQVETVDGSDDPMDVDEIDKDEQVQPSPTPTTPPQSPPKRAILPAFGLRAKDLDDQYVSESEDELAGSGRMGSKYQDDQTLTFSGVPATPTRSRANLPSSALKAANRAIRSVSRGSRLGYTPLAVQLSEWKASSPLKSSKNEQPFGAATSVEEDFSLLETKVFPANEASPSKGFFDDEMRIRIEMENQAAMEAALEADIAAQYDVDDPEFDAMPITHEDVELAAEADEMSLCEPDHLGNMANAQAHDDAISEASQEYGDENAVPIDPSLLEPRDEGRSQSIIPVTPMRASAPRAFHTVSKVPLKPADDSAPRSYKRRIASASKISSRRPAGPLRNATVISYTPTKNNCAMDVTEDDEEAKNTPVTPAKPDIWSTMGTPARTPRRDLNPGLLRGAVVFVDVHTSEGADASIVFVELLNQMGARCVKTWTWNGGEPSASKIGITHVVYKDGGKRTMEKVRESAGVVQCVGVGWVLDCERENEWLDEAPYYIDTSLVPRGGRNRRKSMEPKALANLNGTLVTPIKPSAGPRECQTVPNNHMSRRDSTMWMRTPSDRDEDEDAPGEHDWDSDMSMLTPVPKTPVPEAVHRFAMEVTPETPSAQSYGNYTPETDQLLMRTCPPKQTSTFANLGQGLLGQEKDQNVMMRLMAARRKSLQFAPKIASPLSKAWN